jgi:phosphoribosylanthranilate isomerase
MTSDIRVKICGLSRPQDVEAVARAGAAYAGFVFFPKSPRNVSVEEAAVLAGEVPVGICKVGLVVNASDAELDAILDAVPLDMLQLHGKERPERVSEVKALYGLPVMKAIGIADASDLPQIDANPPRTADLPGGNGLSFDWTLLASRKYWQRPWMLAGGLNPENVATAIRMTGARQVDVSSGVESAPGVKDAGRITRFVEAAKA